MWKAKTVRTALVAGIAALGMGLVTAAQAADPYHIRGTIESVDGAAITVKTREGPVQTVQMGDGVRMFIVDTATLGDIQAGQFVGITSIMSGDKRLAIEVHIFDESLRGLAEGHYPWDLVDEPNMMTNAAVAQIVGVGMSRELTVTYSSGGDDAKTFGTQVIRVPPEATIVHFDNTGAENVVEGKKIFMLAIDQEDGSIMTPALVVGVGDLMPPM